jgi:hypothetical protein
MEQVALIPDQGPVEQFAPAGLYPASSSCESVGAEYSATLCDLGVFMNEPVTPDDLDVGVDGVG